MLNTEAITKRLQEVLQYYTLSASAFADKIGVQRSSISHILSGRNKPSLEFVLKVTDAFEDIRLEWLVNGKGNFPEEDNVPVALDTITAPEHKIESTPPPTNNDLFSTQNKVEPNQQLPPIISTKQLNTNSHRIVTKVIIFYNDRSFEVYDQ